jgi:hypothetical protein
MKPRLLTLTLLGLALASCSSVPPQTITVTGPEAPPVSFTTGKDAQTTAKAAALAAAAWYLQRITNQTAK